MPAWRGKPEQLVETHQWVEGIRRANRFGMRDEGVSAGPGGIFVIGLDNDQRDIDFRALSLSLSPPCLGSSVRFLATLPRLSVWSSRSQSK